MLTLSIHAAVLHFQLKEIPEDFFVDIVSRNNFLTSTLHVSCVHSAHGRWCTSTTQLIREGLIIDERFCVSTLL